MSSSEAGRAMSSSGSGPVRRSDGGPVAAASDSESAPVARTATEGTGHERDIPTADSMPVVQMWSDGACKGNPGPGGWGVWMRAGSHEKELFGGEENTTNNRMELTAVIEGLKALNTRCQVRLHVDSSYVMQGMTSWLPGWKRNGWRTAAKKPVKNEDLWRALDEQVSRHEVHWKWVKGHAGNEGNERADDLANRGVESLQR